MSNMYQGKNTQERAEKKRRKKKRKAVLITVFILLAAALGLGAFYMFYLKDAPKSPGPGENGSSAPQSPEPQNTDSPASGSQEGSQPQAEDTAAPGGVPGTTGADGKYIPLPLPDEMRGMWISFLELRDADLSSEAKMREFAVQTLDNCASLGINTVFFASRPFGDALYESALFPWSHVINGAQGQAPGYDPLAIYIQEAHLRGIRVEAWINPYRVQHPTNGPEELSPDNPASQNPAWVKSHSGLWYDPGLPEVRELVLSGVMEIVNGYDVDGIHFDDYFYPEGNTEEFDADSYAQYGGGLDLAAWRRQNVNQLVQSVYEAIKAENPGVSFGISPQGNNANNYRVQHSDVNLWLSSPGYADYIMPQLYWGFNYIKKDDGSAAFKNKVAEWAGYERSEAVRLYCGLGAYRIGAGDGSDGDMAEWSSGHNLADMVSYLRGADGFEGFALFRYGFLFEPFDAAANQELAKSETGALSALLNN